MSGLVWNVPAEGGYLYADELSKYLRTQVQALCKFRQLCDAEDGTQKGLGRGQTFTWDVVSNVARQGWQLAEDQPMPETNFTVSQRSLTVTEYGNSVPFTSKLEDLAQHKVNAIIDKALKHDARKAFDKAAFLQFKNTTNRFAPTSGTSTTAITVTTNSATATTNNVAMGTGHVKAISDYMKEANVPQRTGGFFQ